MSERKNDSLITIIVPVYNHERYVEDTIRSLIAQTHEDLELIIIDDGSTDDSSEKVRNLESECFARFVNYLFVEKENEGIIKTLNLGISLSQGRFLYIIASDDIAETDALAVLYGFLSNNPNYGLVVGGNTLIDEEGKLCYWDENHRVVYSSDDAYALTIDEGYRRSRIDVDFYSDEFGCYGSLLRGNYIPNGYLLDKEVVDMIGGYSLYSPLEDYYMMLQISKHKKLKYIDKPLFRYRWHSSNTMKNNEAVGRSQRETIFQERGYCLRNGYFLLWLRAVYWSAIKYYWLKVANLIIRE